MRWESWPHNKTFPQPRQMVKLILDFLPEPGGSRLAAQRGPRSWILEGNFLKNQGFLSRRSDSFPQNQWEGAGRLAFPRFSASQITCGR